MADVADALRAVARSLDASASQSGDDLEVATVDVDAPPHGDSRCRGSADDRTSVVRRRDRDARC